jgi:glucokinase
VFSARVIEAAAASAVSRGVASVLTAAFGGRAHEIACRDVFEAAAVGDRLCRNIVDRAVARLAGALAGLLLIFDPEVVIVGGQIAEAGAPLFDPLAEQVAERTEGMLRRRVPIVRAEVTDGVVGAASLAWSHPAEQTA